jgi:tetratricopeptide (TPR) repeat protein
MQLSFMDALQRGVSVQKNGNLEEAERIYREIVELYSKHPAADHDLSVIAMVYNNLGFVLQTRGEFLQASENYRQAVSLQPEFCGAYNNLGVVLHILGDLVASIDSFKKAIAIKPDYAEVFYNMGRVLQDKGDLKASIDSYQTVISLRPDSPDALNALGTSLQLDGDLDAAIEAYNRVLKLDPDYVEAYNNLALIQQTNKDLASSIENCQRAIRIKPGYANAYITRGHAQFDQGDLDSAIESYELALKHESGSVHAYNNLGIALREAGKYAQAIECFDSLNQPRFKEMAESDPTKHLFWFNAVSQALECLYLNGDYLELESRLERLGQSGDINRRIAAVSAFVSHQLGFENQHSFCKNPLDFFHVGNLGDYVADVEGFVDNLLAEADQLHQVWEPQHGVTRVGYQTPNTIFQAGETCGALEDILHKEISSYHSKFSSEDCALITLWPDAYDLKGWLARLLRNGFQRSHIHPAGWISGVVYLKTIDKQESDEGAIKLSIHGYDLPIINKDYPRKIHRPKKGEIILFPSSLFHGTIPFGEDVERSVIAFDLLPS